MRKENLICSIAIALLLCFTAFAVPKVDRGVGHQVDKTKPTVAVMATDHFAVTEQMTSAFEVAISPPDIAAASTETDMTAAIDARGWIPTGTLALNIKSPPIRTDTQRSTIWTPNIGYEGRPTGLLPEQTARSGSLN